MHPDREVSDFVDEPSTETGSPASRMSLANIGILGEIASQESGWEACGKRPMAELKRPPGDCKTVYPGSIPGVASSKIKDLDNQCFARKFRGSLSGLYPARKLPEAGGLHWAVGVVGLRLG